MVPVTQREVNLMVSQIDTDSMNGVHDLGGMHGFGPVDVDEATFHADWERTAFAMNLLLLAQDFYELDEFRHAVERMPPERYLIAGYYERWLSAIERLCIERGLLTKAEVERRQTAIENGDYDFSDRMDVDLVDTARSEFESDRFSRTADGPEPKFQPGEDVIVRNRHPEGHVRTPKYARRAQGVVRSVRGPFPVPETVVNYKNADIDTVYSVEIPTSELWGGSYDEPNAVHLDLWERHLSPASSG
ncbi:nitrile hydratase subunit beta [Saliphagus sp. GCM10025334]